MAIESLAQRARRNTLRERIERMLRRTGFGDIRRQNGEIIRRAPAAAEVERLVQFAMDNHLDNERSTRMYELYAEARRREIERELRIRDQ